MRLRKLLLATVAIVAAGAMALAPASQAANPTGGPITKIAVNGVVPVPPVDYPIVLTMKTAVVQVAVYGITTTITCTAGSANGVIHAGVGTSSATLTSMSLTCPSIFPGTTVAFSLACNVEVPFSDPNVHTGLGTIDTGNTAKISTVDGSLQATNGGGTHCVQVTISNGCTFRVGGSATAKFDEATKVVGTQTRQEVYLSGNGLQIKNPVGCLGAVVNNQAITLTATFNVYTAAGLIDFRNL